MFVTGVSRAVDTCAPAQFCRTNHPRFQSSKDCKDIKFKMTITAVDLNEAIIHLSRIHPFFALQQHRSSVITGNSNLAIMWKQGGAE